MENQSRNLITANPETRFGALRWAWLIAGWLALVLGAIGVLMPIMPTAPFLILAVACFSRSSEYMLDRIYGLPFAGKFLRDWQGGEGISPGLKFASVAALWLTAFWTLLTVAKTALAKILVLGLTVVVSLVTLAMPGRRKSP